MKDLTIICVLKSGGAYTTEHVVRLFERVKQNTTLDYNFCCLTDIGHEFENRYLDFSQINIIPLFFDYKGWWSKIELFDSNCIPGKRIVYFDLDTLIVKNIDALLLREESFIGLRAFNPTQGKRKDYIASGILSWINDGRFDYILQEFIYNHHTKIFRGDQDYITNQLNKHQIRYSKWQNLIDGVFSYKRHYLKGNTSKKTCVLCFHGKPRIQDVNTNEVIQTLS